MLNAQLEDGIVLNDRYQIQTKLGSGGFGQTYLAQDQHQEGHPCAIKEFSPLVQDTKLLDKAKELFIREAQVLQRISHPQVPKYLDFFEWEERLFLVQDYIEGSTYLDCLLSNRTANRPMNAASIFQWLLDLLPLLDYLHQNNIYHRDIAPDNIIQPSDGGKPVLIDFGAVKHRMTALITASRTGIFGSSVGKYGYASPEQFQQGEIDGRSDLYSLGVTALVLLTNRNPDELRDRDLKWCWQNDCSLHPRFAAILEQMTAHHPSDRYPSATAVITALQPLASSILNPTHLDPSVTVLSDPPRTAPDAAPVPPRPTWRDRWARLSHSLRSRHPTFGPKPMFTTLAVSSCALVLAGGYALIPYSPLCKTFERCAQEEKWHSQYQKADQTIATLENRRDPLPNIAALESAIADLDQALETLETLPTLALDYEQAQANLPQHRQLRDRLQQTLQQEQQAAAQLDQAERDYQRAQTADPTYANLTDLETAVAAAEASVTTLTQIAPDTYVHAAAQTQLDDARQLHERLRAKLTTEQAAATAIADAQSLAHQARAAATQANTLAGYRQARDLWSQANNILDQVGSDTLAASAAAPLIPEYRTALEQMRSKVAALTPRPAPPAPRQSTATRSGSAGRSPSKPASSSTQNRPRSSSSASGSTPSRRSNPPASNPPPGPPLWGPGSPGNSAPSNPPPLW
jgi:serine/threonine protein kinase